MLPRDIVGGVLLLMVIVLLSESAINELKVPANTGCACPDDVLIYNCTVVGTGNTLWTGTAFDCNADLIILRHSQFESQGAYGECNDGNVVGRSLSVQSNCYTSQLNVTINTGLNNKTISCIHNSVVGRNVIGISTLTVVQGPGIFPYPPPNDVHLADVHSGVLSFKWTSLDINCTSIYYGIRSNCGTCPNTTFTSTVNCTNLKISTNASMCAFSVYSVLCRNVLGRSSNPIMVNLKVPDAPEVIIVPTYSRVDGILRLIRLTATFIDTMPQEPFTISDELTDSIVNYTFSLTSSSGSSNNVSTPPCVDNACELSVDVQFPCDSSIDVSVSISALSKLGQGPPSNLITIGCINRFLRVSYDSSTSAIACMFQNQPFTLMNTVTRSCRVKYWICDLDSRDVEIVEVNTTSYIATVKLSLQDSNRAYCYIVAGDNGTHTAQVEGRIDLDGRGVSATVIVTSIFIAFVAIILLIVIIVVILIMRRHTCMDNYTVSWRKDGLSNVVDEEVHHLPVQKEIVIKKVPDRYLVIGSKLQLKEIDPSQRYFMRFHVTENCSLKEFVGGCDLPFKRGCAFYEFKDYTENISAGKEVSLCSEEEGIYTYFYPISDDQILRQHSLLGEGVTPPTLKNHKVFIQSMGSGVRHLQANTDVLYLAEHPLICIDTKNFKLAEVPNDCELKDFCNKLKTSRHSVLVEYHDNLKGDGTKLQIIDCIIMDKVTQKLFTGNFGRRILSLDKDQCRQIESIRKQWNIFVLPNIDEEVKLRKDSLVLLQVEGQKSSDSPLWCIDSTQFELRKVGTKCRLGDFCKTHCLDPFLFVEVKTPKQTADHPLYESDVILMDCQNQSTFTHNFTWKDIISCANQKCKKTDQDLWTIFFLEFKEGYLLEIDTKVWCRVNPQVKDRENCKMDRLVPLYSHPFSLKLKSNVTTSQRMFVELQKDMMNEIQDVIFMRRGTKDMFSGPFARQLIHEKDIEDLKKSWHIFVLFKAVTIPIEENYEVLTQTEEHEQYYLVVNVTEDNVRMSEFIKNHPEIKSFENGRAFYEFIQEEDLNSYRDVICVASDKLKMATIIPQIPTFTTFYEIPGAPDIRINPPNFREKKKTRLRFFVQSTSQGSRCLKKGVLLYKITKEQSLKSGADWHSYTNQCAK